MPKIENVDSDVRVTFMRKNANSGNVVNNVVDGCTARQWIIHATFKQNAIDSVVVTASSLTKQLKVHPRTIQRDFVVLASNHLTAFSVVVREPNETSMPEHAQFNGKAIPVEVQDVINKLIRAFPNFGKVHAKTISTLLVACITPSMAKDIMTACGLSSRTSFDRVYFGPLREMGLLSPTYPDNPRHPQQKYYLTELGLAVLDALNNK